ncbi:MAG: hypothetical protein AAFX05_12170 [Planctomycetota bacterium]
MKTTIPTTDDARVMVLLVNTAIIAIVVLTTLYTLANCISVDLGLLKLRIEASRIRQEYLARLAELRRPVDDIDMVEIVEDLPDEPVEVAEEVPAAAA